MRRRAAGPHSPTSASPICRASCFASRRPMAMRESPNRFGARSVAQQSQGFKIQGGSDSGSITSASTKSATDDGGGNLTVPSMPIALPEGYARTMIVVAPGSGSVGEIVAVNFGWQYGRIATAAASRRPGDTLSSASKFSRYCSGVRPLSAALSASSRVRRFAPPGLRPAPFLRPPCPFAILNAHELFQFHQPYPLR
jgi:hypothetical protein